MSDNTGMTKKIFLIIGGIVLAILSIFLYIKNKGCCAKAPSSTNPKQTVAASKTTAKAAPKKAATPRRSRAKPAASSVESAPSAENNSATENKPQ